MSDFIRTDDGRAFIAQRLHGATEVHLAWGSGDPSWSAGPPDPDGTETALVAEIGRRRATEVAYVVPDGAGDINLGPYGVFSRSPADAPTGYVFCRFEFDLADAVGADIKEVGIFLNTVVNGGVPPGQDYILPADYSNAGVLFTLANLAPAEQFTVSGLVRPAWYYVFTA